MPSSRFAFALLLLPLAACGGGSPTEPQTPVPLEGTWAGTITVTSPAPTSTCSVTLRLDKDPQDPTFFPGDWSANCSGVQGNGITVAILLPGGPVILTSLLGSPVFDGCGWSSVAQRNGRRMSGDWQTPQNCQTGPARSGRIELDKQN